MYLGDEHAFNCPHTLLYKIEEYMPNSIQETYGMVGVRDKWIREAIQIKKSLTISAPKGAYQFDPKMIKKRMKTFDQVGFYVDRPMKMYALQIWHSEKKPTEAYQFA